MVIRLSIYFVIFVIVKLASAQTSCTTPDNWNGNCIELQQCRPLFRLVRPHISTKERNFLRNSTCSRDGNKILVCCPNTFTINDLPSTQYCGKEVGDKNVGDGVTTIYESPWTALLHYKSKNESYQKYTEMNRNYNRFLCAGVLIHENYVITTADCILAVSIIRSQRVVDSVRLGEHDLSTNPDCKERNQCADPVEDIPVAEIIIHEDYKLNPFQNDIALIRLESAVPYTDFIRPICLPVGKLQNRNYEGYSMILAGFGRTDEASSSKTKLKVSVKGIDLNQCVNTYRNLKVNLTNGKQICVDNEDGIGGCNGDEGGALEAVEKDDEFSYLAGIFSLAPYQCGSAPGVYTRIDQYIDWILDHMKKP